MKNDASDMNESFSESLKQTNQRKKRSPQTSPVKQDDVSVYLPTSSSSPIAQQVAGSGQELTLTASEWDSEPHVNAL
jgi:hypothetical protein